jgi:cell division septum initiation protein DivIVA
MATDRDGTGSGGALPVEAIAGREFNPARRGYEPAEVRRFLTAVSNEIAHLRATTEDLTAQLAAARQARPAAPPVLTEEQVVAAVGEEMAGILRTAHSAANDLKTRAAQESERIVTEARQRAAGINAEADDRLRTAAADADARLAKATAEAEERLRRAKAEADERIRASKTDAEERINASKTEAEERARTSKAEAAERTRSSTAAAEKRLAEATAEAERRVAEATGEAESVAARLREESTREAHQILGRARLDSEAVRQQAEQDRRMTVEGAQAIRERILGDLARRRRVATVQIEQLRAGRERLLESYAVVRRTLEEVHDELQRADAEARAAADEAGRRLQAEREAPPVAGQVSEAEVPPVDLPEVESVAVIEPATPSADTPSADTPSADTPSADTPATTAPGIDEPTVAVQAISDAAASSPAPSPSSSPGSGGPVAAPTAGGAPAVEAAPMADPAPSSDPGPSGTDAVPARGSEAAPVTDPTGPDPATATLPDAATATDAGSASAARAAGPGDGGDGDAGRDAAATDDGAGGRPGDGPDGATIDGATIDGPAGPAGPAGDGPTGDTDDGPGGDGQTGDGPADDGPTGGGPGDGGPDVDAPGGAGGEGAAGSPVGGSPGPAGGPAAATRDRVRLMRVGGSAATRPTGPGASSSSVGRLRSLTLGSSAVAIDHDVDPVDRAAGLELVPDARPAGDEAIGGLFDRIRAGREQSLVSARRVLAAAPEVVAPVPPVAVAAAHARPTPPVHPLPVEDPPAGTAVRTRPRDGDSGIVYSDADEALLQRRDADLEPLTVTLTRRLKRALQDDHSDLLDRIRHAGSATRLEAVLPAEAVHIDRFASVLAPFLVDAAAAGRRYAAALVPAAAVAATEGATATAAATATASLLIEPLRGRIAAALTEAGDGGGDSVGDALAAIYRDTRSQRTERLAGDALAAAYTEAAWRAVPSATPLRWLADDVDGPCADCDDNVLAGPVPTGDAFPTGQLHPPAHDGCRCLLAPGH